MFSCTSRTRTRGALCLVGLAFLTAVPALIACSTPVYRYAMYNWESSPYEIYFFHDQAAGTEDEKITRAFKDAWESREDRANVRYIPVNVVEDKELKRIPPDVRQAYLSRENPTLPTYLISTPYGSEIFYGKLEEKMLPSLMDSPARQELARQLAEGKIGVLLFLTCSDEAANEAVEKVLQELVQDVKAGKVEFYMPPPSGPTPGAPDGEEIPQGPTPELGHIKVVRDDPKEEWLVRQLLAMEPDLKDEDSPMVFMSYGRARALLPYVGKGITRDNLLYELEFVTGACSCTVKEQNPGVDLLVRHDWETAAVELAEKFSGDEGNPYGPGTFFPELVIPSGGEAGAAAEIAATEGAAEMTEDPEIEQEPAASEEESPGGEKVVLVTSEVAESTEPEVAESTEPEVAESTEPEAAEAAAGSEET
ncbi:MAG: hypothetical protein ACC628_14825, partial [Pirellulaceae bacterium]